MYCGIEVEYYLCFIFMFVDVDVFNWIVFVVQGIEVEGQICVYQIYYYLVWVGQFVQGMFYWFG